MQGRALAREKPGDDRATGTPSIYEPDPPRASPCPRFRPAIDDPSTDEPEPDVAPRIVRWGKSQRIACESDAALLPRRSQFEEPAKLHAISEVLEIGVFLGLSADAGVFEEARSGGGLQPAQSVGDVGLLTILLLFEWDAPVVSGGGCAERVETSQAITISAGDAFTRFHLLDIAEGAGPLGDAGHFGPEVKTKIERNRLIGQLDHLLPFPSGFGVFPIPRERKGFVTVQAEGGSASARIIWFEAKKRLDVLNPSHRFVNGILEASRLEEHPGPVGSRVAQGGFPPRAPTDPDGPNSGIRLFRPGIRYVTWRARLRRARGSG
jgi:hypothetical protein